MHGEDFTSCDAWSFSTCGRHTIDINFRDQGKYIPVGNRAQHQKLMLHQLSTSEASQRLKSFWCLPCAMPSFVPNSQKKHQKFIILYMHLSLHGCGLRTWGFPSQRNSTIRYLYRHMTVSNVKARLQLYWNTCMWKMQLQIGISLVLL